LHNPKLTMRGFWVLRASVGSTEAAKDVVARFGRIDRSDRLSPFIDSHNALCPGAQALC
jgi:hypothetical protein